MNQAYNIYSDESCHLENDHQSVMVLGAVWCPVERTRQIAAEIRDIKRRHGLSGDFEVKWSKVSPGKQAVYLDLVDYFFGNPDLHFRAVVIPDKTILRHDHFRQSHDEWYYKMYFRMLERIIQLETGGTHYIYLDVKDTRSADKVRKLQEVLCNSIHDFDGDVIKRVQTVRSDEVEQVQLADLLIGAVGYANRKLRTSSAKLALIARIQSAAHCILRQSTAYQASKFNLLIWRPKDSADA